MSYFFAAESNSPAFVWDEPSTKLLIVLRGDRHADFTSPNRTKKSCWDEICNIMKAMGYQVTRVQAENKWKNLTRRFVCCFFFYYSFEFNTPLIF